MNQHSRARPLFASLGCVNTTRQALYGSEDDSFEQDAAAVADLETVLTENLAWQADGWPARKHKVTHTSNEVEADRVLDFRLLSTSKSGISLSEKPLPYLRRVERPTEDSETELEERRRRAQEAAVDFKDIIAQSRVPYTPRPSSSNKVIPFRLLNSETHQEISTIIITERKPAQTCTESIATKKFLCPTVPVGPCILPSKSSKPSRKPPQFFQPQTRCGYAMGYEGSWALDSGGGTKRKKYIRDTMK